MYTKTESMILSDMKYSTLVFNKILIKYIARITADNEHYITMTLTNSK